MHILKRCKCGKSEQTFKFDIGPFFIAECCEAAGYNEKGELKKKPLKTDNLPSKEELEKAAAAITPDLSPEPKDETETPQAPTADSQTAPTTPFEKPE